ncbi:MAG: ribonuclease HI [Planctomycetes bacterium]|nr:ribonuclease HI [Planctomycetota bacterium]
MIEAFSDGACRGNPGEGGWGVVIRDDAGERELSGYSAQTTNNQMELTAAIEALRAIPAGAEVRLVTDSRYVVDGITSWIHGWIRRDWRKADKKPVLNKELWQALHLEAQRRSVSWEWVRGHAGHPENERCDELANEAIDRRSGPLAR